jgi:hypothetical protein
VVPDAPKLKAQQARQASMSPLPVQDLPAKGTFLVAWEADIGQTKLEAISRTYKVGSAQATNIYQPIVRAELRIHTGKQTVSLKKRIELVASSGAKFGTNIKEVKFSNIDESLFWITEDWDW